MNFLRCIDSSGPGSATSSGLIKEGDCVIVYESFNSMKAVYVTSKGRFESRFGIFHFKSWIGKPFGSKVMSDRGQGGWVILLRPTPELWTQVLRHRTQILYLADISMVVTYLDLQPGSVVLESGTGSGSLTHSLVRAVAPKGHVHTFEFHAGRAEDAAAEFKQHGLSGLVTVTQRNIEELGFPESLHGAADAVFLDLPGPFKVVPSAASCLKPNGRFCAFSPCIEQVQRTAEALSRSGFTEVITYECLLREYDVHRGLIFTGVELDGPQAKRPRTDPSVATTAAATGPADHPKVAQPDEAGPAGPAAAAPAATVGAETPADAAAAGNGNSGEGSEAPIGGKDVSGKPSSGVAEGDEERQLTVRMETDKLAGAGAARGDKAEQGQGPQQQQKQPRLSAFSPGRLALPEALRMVHCQPAREARGHTGYLTFARKFVCG